uniref:Uncharacterized protein n=1 Tax=Polysiphonia scopulorum TaxID=257860 RepID=A0A1Z1MHP0_9FLOR|nr:hypothetical protein [Polysiphonia scopulorum]ARW65600.1 hypothetical protein [Polysiphonia scopulorum]
MSISSITKIIKNQNKLTFSCITQYILRKSTKTKRLIY